MNGNAESGRFYGVFAPAWETDTGLCIVLRALAEQQDSDRNRAVLLTAADRIEAHHIDGNPA